jgi:hypothetical protein
MPCTDGCCCTRTVRLGAAMPDTDRGVPSVGVRVQMSTTTDQLRTHNLARTP